MEWIEVSRRLPAQGIEVFLRLNSGKYRVGYFAGRYYGFKGANGDYLGSEHPMDFTSENSPSHWILPKPPKETK